MAPTLEEIMSSGVRRHTLEVGECVFTNRDMLLSTPLGSCVSATFHHPGTRLAAMFHAFLPEAPDEEQMAGHCTYVDLAVEGIAERLAERGVRFGEVAVRLVGGMSRLGRNLKGALADKYNVGRRNVLSARQCLRDRGFRVLEEDVLGGRGRTLYFHTGSGLAWVRVHGDPRPGRVAAPDPAECLLVDICDVTD